MNFVFISPTFPPQYYQFPKAVKAAGNRTLGIAEDNFENLMPELQEVLDDYYRVDSLEDYNEVYRAVAFFAFKYGKIDWLESNNEYWLEQDARLRTDFNITSGANTAELQHYKYKSQMKAFYEAAGIPVARYHMVSTYEEGKAFIDMVGYPVVVKPDNGVGANATYKLSNDEDLARFYATPVSTQYIMEEFVKGDIVSFDGIAGPNSEIIFCTSHFFPDPIMDIVNGEKECWYHSVREIPEDLMAAGKGTIASFKPRSRFFHCEFFRLTEAKEGLGDVGTIVGLEVNMRPPGGFTPDMFNFANDIDCYRIYADMITNGTASYDTTRPYYCVHVGKRDSINYKHSREDVENKFAGHICISGRMPDLLSVAMGQDMFIARFSTMDEVNEFVNYTYERAE